MSNEEKSFKIKKIGINLFIVLIVLNIYLSVINLSNARFVTESGTKANATIAKWDFKVSDNENSFENTLDIALNNGNPIVPGDTGNFDVYINTEECDVGVEYKIKIDDIANTLPSNMKFYQIIDGKEVYFTLGEFCETQQIEANENGKTQKIYWIWNLTDDHEEQYIGKNFKIDLKITGSNKIEV